MSSIAEINSVRSAAEFALDEGDLSAFNQANEQFRQLDLPLLAIEIERFGGTTDEMTIVHNALRMQAISLNRKV